MSKIDEALEKAAKMRESQKAATGDGPEKTVVPENRFDLPGHTADVHKFVVSGAPADTTLVDKHLVSITDPYSLAAEQYKKLRARVIRATQKNFHNTIMIVSANMDEGKSTTAANLALALSQEIDHTVLLVDADLRRPSLHSFLGIEPKYGLSDYLKNGMDLSDIIIKTGYGKLALLPGGNVTENHAELLSSQKMKKLMQELKVRYKDRYVIVDSTPLLAASDALALGSYMDAILFVIQAGKTSEKSAMHALSLMKGWNILGVVYNDVSPYLTRISPTPYSSYHYGKGSSDETAKKDKGGATNTQ